MADVAMEGLRHALEAERKIARPSNLRTAWEQLLKEARGCRRCELYKCGTQTVLAKARFTRS